MKNLSILSSIKIPEFIREEYPTLVTFVEAYYSYLEQLDSISSATDIDSAADKFLVNFKNTVARNFDDPNYISVRSFILANKDFFSKKGTEEAFKFFFRAYFNEDIDIIRPNYLVASGGEASGDFFFYINTVEGTLNKYDQLTLERTYSSNININVVDIKKIDNVYVVYFIPPIGFTSKIGDSCTVTDSTGNIQFKGLVKETPVKVKITKPGKFWQVGQIFELPGTVSNTILRVTAVDANSGISKADIVKFGYPIFSSEYSVSSLSRVADDHIDSSTVQSETNPLDDRYFNESIEIIDNISGVIDTVVVATITTGGADDYFQDAYPGDYTLQDYVGTLQAFNETIVAVPSGDQQKYNDSISSFRFIMDSYSKEKNTYLSENSLISNQNSRVHDNLNYQAFAYSLLTETDIKKYRSAFDLLHPAGMKFLATLVKKFDKINNISIAEHDGFTKFNGNKTQSSIGNVKLNMTMGINGNSSSTQIG